MSSALSQIMLFVDGMNGVINHNETVQWLYTLTGSLVSNTLDLGQVVDGGTAVNIRAELSCHLLDTC